MEEIKSNKLDINKYFEALKAEDYDESFDMVESWLRREQFFNSGKTGKTKAGKIRYYIFAHRAKLAYVVLLFFVTLIVANVKVTSKETLAGVVSWTVDKNNKEAIEKIDKSEWLDKSQLVVDAQTGDDTNLIKYKIIVSDDSKLNLEQLKIKLDEIKDLKYVEITPITENVNVPIYAAALHSIFNSDIPDRFVNAEAVKQNVYEQLRFAGVDDDDFDVDYASEAPRSMKLIIKIPQDSLKHKIHDDIMKNINTDKIIQNTAKMIENLKSQLQENLPRIQEEYGNYYNYDSEKLNKALRKFQIKLDSMKYRFDDKEFEKSMESLKSLDTLGEFINRQVEESIRMNEQQLRLNEDNIRRNEEYMRKNEERMQKNEERMREREEELNSLDTLGDYINEQVEINLEKNLQHLKILDSLGPFIQKQIRIQGDMNFDTAKFNRKMEKMRIKMDSLNFHIKNYKNNNENEDEIKEEKDDDDDNSDMN